MLCSGFQVKWELVKVQVRARVAVGCHSSLVLLLWQRMVPVCRGPLSQGPHQGVLLCSLDPCLLALTEGSLYKGDSGHFLLHILRVPSTVTWHSHLPLLQHLSGEDKWEHMVHPAP